MLVAACHDFLTQSGVGMRLSSSCCGKNPAPVVNRAADGSYVYDRHFSLTRQLTWPVHTSQNRKHGPWSALWLLNGSSSTLQPLVRSYIVIYEPRWVVLAKGLISVVVLWFCWFLLILPTCSAEILEQVHMKMLWLWRPPPLLSSTPLEALCYPLCFVSAAGKLNRD